MCGKQNCDSVEGSGAAVAVAMLAPLPAVSSTLSNEQSLHISNVTDPQLFNQIADLYSEVMNGEYVHLFCISLNNCKMKTVLKPWL